MTKMGVVTTRAALAAAWLAALGVAASAQVMPPPIEPVTDRPLALMDVPGLPPRSLTGGLTIDLPTGPPPDVVIIRRLPAPDAQPARRTQRRAVRREVD